MGELKKQTVSGVKWLVGSSFLQKAISTATTIVLARILGPAEFGLFALAFVAIDALGLFKSVGFDSALIQRKDNVERAANTAFFIIPFIGFVLYFILAMSASWIGRFLNNQDVVGVIRALGVIFVISCFGKVPAALLDKNMKFRQVSIIEIGTVIVYAICAVSFALLKLGVWSLVYAYILKTVYYNIFSFIYSGWRPKLEFDKRIAIEMFRFGKFLFLGGLVYFLKMNLDNLLVGKLLGVTALGLYAIAFNISNFGADYFGGKVHRVIYPAFSKLQGDLVDLRSAVLKTFKCISIVVVPLGIGIFFLSGDLLRFVYGDKWVAASSVLKILALAGIFNALPISFNATYLASGKPKLAFLLLSIQVALFFIFIAPMTRLFGIDGVAWVVTGSAFIALITNLILGKKILSISIKQVYLGLRPSLFASFLMAIGIIFLKYSLYYFLDATIFSHLNFIALLCFCVVVYVVLLFKFEKPLFNEIRRMCFNVR